VARDNGKKADLLRRPTTISKFTDGLLTLHFTLPPPRP